MKELISNNNANDRSVVENYIEKIIQKPVLIPKIQQEYINNFLLYSDHPIPNYSISNLKDIKSSNESITTYGTINSINKNFITIKYENLEIEIEITEDKYRSIIKLDLSKKI